MKTFSVKPSQITRNWYIVDASVLPLGRLSTHISTILMGKNKPLFTKHIDCGDYVVVINSDKLVVTGNKLTQKKYYHHSMHPGGLKEIDLQTQLQKDSRKVIYNAVRGMLPVNKLRDQRLTRLKIYKDENHNHDPQKPTQLNLEAK